MTGKLKKKEKKCSLAHCKLHCLILNRYKKYFSYSFAWYLPTIIIQSQK